MEIYYGTDERKRPRPNRRAGRKPSDTTRVAFSLSTLGFNILLFISSTTVATIIVKLADSSSDN